MKKLTSLLLALILVFSLAACGEKPKETTVETTTETTAETEAETTVETEAETTAETEAETTAEAEVPFDRTPASKDGEIEKIGLGMSVKLEAKDAKEGKGNTTSNVTVAGLAFDAEGKIVKAYIDVAQSKFAVNDEGTFATPAAEAVFKTKLELGDKYDMKKASGIGKEYYEQAKAFEEYILGKTAEEVAAIATEKKDDKHLNVPTDADLVSSVTIDIGEYQKAVVNAWENAVEAKGATKLGLDIQTKLGNRTAEAKDDKGANVQFETTASLVATDAEGKVVKASTDNAQNAIGFNADGTVATDLSVPGTTKRTRGEEYGMRKSSGIQKEWFEQVAALDEYVIGKTSDEISAIPTEKRDDSHLHVPVDADLLSTTTITIEAYQLTLSNAAKSAK